MANTVSLLSYANTFGDWIVKTNSLIKENNDLAANNYTKPAGTLYLNDSILGLSVANNAVVAGQLQVQGVGSSAYVQNNLRVDQQVYFTNTSLGLVNSGQANIGGLLLAKGSGTGLQVSNNAVIGVNFSVGGTSTLTGDVSAASNLTVSGNTAISGNTSITKNLTVTGNTSVTGTTLLNGVVTVNSDLNSLANVNNSNTTSKFYVTANTVSANNWVQAPVGFIPTFYTNSLQANTNIVSAALTNTGAITTDTATANTRLTTPIISVGTSVNAGGATGNFNNLTAGYYVANNYFSGPTGFLPTLYTNSLQANTNIVTAALTSSGAITTDTATANTRMTAPIFSVGTSVNAGGATGNFNTLTSGSYVANTFFSGPTGYIQTLYATTIQANTNIVTAALTTTGTSRSDTVTANTIINTPFLSVGTTVGAGAAAGFFNNLTSGSYVANSFFSGPTGYIQTLYANTIQSNTNIVTATLTSTGTVRADIVTANTAVNVPIVTATTLNATGTTYTNNLQANTNVNTPLLTATNATVATGVITNTLQANSFVNTATVFATNNLYTNNLQANSSVSSVNLNVSNVANVGTLAANTTVTTPTLTVTGGSLNATSAAGAFASLSVSGNFTINGTTIYNSPNFTLSALTPNQTITIGGYRTNNANTQNSQLRFTETNKYWEMNDAAGNNITTFYRVLTDQYRSDSLTTSGSTNIATSNAVFALNTNITAANNYASSGYAQANAATNSASAAYLNSNSAFIQANAAFNKANSHDAYIAASYAQANAATNSAQAAYNKANTGGTFSGDVTIAGNLIVSGTTTTVNTATITARDSLIKLADGNPADAIDIGFYGTYVNAGTKYTGLVRQAGGNYWLLTGITSDPASNNLPSGSFTQANTSTLNANITGYIVSNGYELYNLTTASYAQANAATNSAQSGYNQANATNNYATSAYAQANATNNLTSSAYNLANTHTTQIAVIQGVDLTQNTNITAVNNFAQGAFDQANATNNYATSAYAQANAATNSAQAAYNKANTTVLNFIGTSGIATANNNYVTLTSTNGVTVSGTSNTLTFNTPQDLRTSASPTFNGLTLTNALGINYGGTGASSSSQALTNLLPTGTTAGYVLTTGGPGSFYWAASSGGGGAGATPGTTINSTRLSYTGNGTGIAYTTPSYTPGASQLRVFIDGVRQFPSTYTETSNTVVSFTTSPPNGAAILLEVDGYFANPYYANNIAYTVNANISPTANTIQLAIDGLTNKLVTNYALQSFAQDASTKANTGLTITSTSTNATYYVGFQSATSGNSVINYVNTNLNFNPSTGVMSSPIFSSTSDVSLKDNINTIENSLEKVTQLRGVTFTWKDSGKNSIGVIAQEVEKILPEIVSESDGIKHVSYDQIVGLLIEAIKELKQEVDQLKKV